NLLFARHLRSTGDLGLALLGPAGGLADPADATPADATPADATHADVTPGRRATASDSATQADVAPGARATPSDSATPGAPAADGTGATDGAPKGSWQHHVLTAPCVRIASGTDEIQRNIVGERALGLPREPRANV